LYLFDTSIFVGKVLKLESEVWYDKIRDPFLGGLYFSRIFKDD